MVRRKLGATNELFHKVVGTIDTPEKFAQRRLYLAEIVWETMLKTDSRECRNCHHFEFMDLSNQSPLARRKHKATNGNKKSCIDCHRGIAHQIPSNFDTDGELHNLFEKRKRACDDCHSEMAQAKEDW